MVTKRVGTEESCPSGVQGIRNWTQEFQEILRKPVVERGTLLQKLCHDFVTTAKHYGEIIIRERNLPNHLKTVQPLKGKVHFPSCLI